MFPFFTFFFVLIFEKMMCYQVNTVVYNTDIEWSHVHTIHFKKSSLFLIFACEKNCAVFVANMAKLRPHQFRMIYSLTRSLIEVDNGLNMRGTIRKIDIFYTFCRKFTISKNFGGSRKALFITMDLNFFLQNSNLIFKSKLYTNFFKKNIAGNKACIQK